MEKHTRGRIMVRLATQEVNALEDVPDIVQLENVVFTQDIYNNPIPLLEETPSTVLEEHKTPPQNPILMLEPTPAAPEAYDIMPQNRTLSREQISSTSEIGEGALSSESSDENCIFRRRPAMSRLCSSSESAEEVQLNNDIQELCDMEELPQQTLKSRKRKKNESEWRRNTTKTRRQRGECYLSARGVFVPGVAMKPPCNENCRKKCSTKISDEERKIVFETYYKLGNYTRQRDFLHSNIEKNTKKCVTTTNSRRLFSNKFYLPINGEKIEVCKTMFINSFGIRKGIVDIALKKRTGQNIGTEDERGKHVKTRTPDIFVQNVKKHIESFPVVDSHYTRKGTNRKYLCSSLNIKLMYKLYKDMCMQNNSGFVKEPIYRTIFNTHYNLGFHRPKKDQCRTCMAYKNATEEEKANQKLSYDMHIVEKNKAREEKQNDKTLAKNSNGEMVTCNFDLQQVLIVPSDNKNNAFFYKRRLATYNLTVYNVATKEGDCFMWYESEGARGSCEIASCVYKYLKSLPEIVKKVVLFSDRCGGQNLNKFMAGMLMRAVQEFPIESLDLKFLTVGHSEMECDSMHSAIGTEFKRVGQALWPADWQTIAKSARRHGDKPYKVHELNHSDIKDRKGHLEQFMIVRKKATDTLPVSWQKMCHMNFEKKQPLILKFKESFDKQFRTLNCNKPGRRAGLPTLRDLYSGPIGITKEKYKDLVSLFSTTPPVISHNYETFYKSLPVRNNNRTIQSSDEDDLSE